MDLTAISPSWTPPTDAPDASDALESSETTAQWRQALDAFLLTLESDHTIATYRRNVRAFFETPGAPDLPALSGAWLTTYRGSLAARAGLITRDEDAREDAREDADSGASVTGAAVGIAGIAGIAGATDATRLRVGLTLARPPTARRARISTNTAQIRLAALRAFLLWLRHERRQVWAWLPSNAADLDAEEIRYRLRGLHATTERPYQIVENAEETRALLDAAAAATHQPLRALALCALALGAGLRVAELCRVRLGDLGRDGAGVYVRVRGKGHRERLVRLSAPVAAQLTRYVSDSGRLLGRGREELEPLFLSRKRGRGALPAGLRPQQARRIVAGVVADAQRRAPSLADRRLTPHALRHSFAIDALRGSEAEGRPPANVAAVSAMLGHADVRVTSRYLRHQTQQELARYAPTLGLTVAPEQASGDDE